MQPGRAAERRIDHARARERSPPVQHRPVVGDDRVARAPAVRDGQRLTLLAHDLVADVGGDRLAVVEADPSLLAGSAAIGPIREAAGAVGQADAARSRDQGRRGVAIPERAFAAEPMHQALAATRQRSHRGRERVQASVELGRRDRAEHPLPADRGDLVVVGDPPRFEGRARARSQRRVQGHAVDQGRLAAGVGRAPTVKRDQVGSQRRIGVLAVGADRVLARIDRLHARVGAGLLASTAMHERAAEEPPTQLGERVEVGLTTQEHPAPLAHSGADRLDLDVARHPTNVRQADALDEPAAGSVAGPTSRIDPITSRRRLDRRALAR